VTLREVGGAMQQLWRHFYSEAAAIVFVLEVASAAAPVAWTECEAAQPQDGDQQHQQQQQPEQQQALPDAARCAQQHATSAAVVQALREVLSHAHVHGKPLCVVVNTKGTQPQPQQPQQYQEPGREMPASTQQAWLQDAGLQDAGLQELLQQQQGSPCPVIQASALTGQGVPAVLEWVVRAAAAGKTAREQQDAQHGSCVVTRIDAVVGASGAHKVPAAALAG
jgi:hypothetical protein